jgi:hypothetical protein
MKLFNTLGLAAAVLFTTTAYGDIPWEFGTARGHAQYRQPSPAALTASPPWIQYAAAPVWGGIGPAVVPWAGTVPGYPPRMGSPGCYASWMGRNPPAGC